MPIRCQSLCIVTDVFKILVKTEKQANENPTTKSFLLPSLAASYKKIQSNSGLNKAEIYSLPASMRLQSIRGVIAGLQSLQDSRPLWPL